MCPEAELWEDRRSGEWRRARSSRRELKAKVGRPHRPGEGSEVDSEIPTLACPGLES